MFLVSVNWMWTYLLWTLTLSFDHQAFIFISVSKWLDLNKRRTTCMHFNNLIYFKCFHELNMFLKNLTAIILNILHSGNSNTDKELSDNDNPVVPLTKHLSAISITIYSEYNIFSPPIHLIWQYWLAVGPVCSTKTDLCQAKDSEHFFPPVENVSVFSFEGFSVACGHWKSERTHLCLTWLTVQVGILS